MLDRYLQIQDDYEDFYPKSTCKNCEENEQTIDNASEFLQEVIEQIYNKKSFDRSLLENALDELCFYLKVTPIQGEVEIERRKHKKVFDGWISYNNDYIMTLTKEA